MSMEQGLNQQVVKLRRKDLKFIAANSNKNEAKFKFQGKYSRSQRWFDFDFDQIGVNSSTHDPGFYTENFQIHDDTQNTNTSKIFQVPIGNLKCVEIFKFHNDAPMLKYFQKSLNSCYFSSLESALSSIEKSRLTIIYHCAQNNP